MLDLYYQRGFKVTTTLTDGELTPMRRELNAMGVHPNFATANEHVPEIERQICVFKERARACHHSLPFTYLPRLILIEMMHNADLWVYVFPPKGGVSTISPRSLITGIKFDYAKHCQLTSALMPK